MSQTQKIGDQGEALAQNYLIEKGYTIIDTNWSTRFGELDIVAKHEDTYVFVEVKSRRSNTIDNVFVSITPAKRDKMIKAVYQYIHEKELEEALWRIDAIGVALRRNHPPLIEHVEDAFDW